MERYFTITVWLGFFVSFFSSCSPLTKTQTKAIGQYYQTIGNFASYTREVNAFNAKIKLNRLQLYPESYAIDSVMIESLVRSFEGYQKDLEMSYEMDSVLKDLDTYIKKYFILTPNGLKIIKLISGSASVIGRQYGLGNLLTTLSIQSQESNLVPGRARKVKAHIEHGLPIVPESANQIKKYAEILLENSLSVEDEYIRENYRKFLIDLKEKPNSYQYYSIYNHIFIRHFEMIYNTRELAKQLIVSADILEQAHRKLIKKTNEREKIVAGIAEIQELYLAIERMKTTINKLRVLDSYEERINY